MGIESFLRQPFTIDPIHNRQDLATSVYRARDEHVITVMPCEEHTIGNATPNI
jgi:hypothetical protein